MSARKTRKKRKTAVVPAPLVHLIGFVKGRGRAAALVGLCIAVFCGLWYAAWRRVGEDVLLAKEYWLTQQDLEFTPPPEWIHRNVPAEVFRDASLDSPLSITDENLVRRLAEAFSLHPWVAEVRRVSKHYPARVEVELVYRRPVLMVQVPGGLLPVDEVGVLLPSDDFSPLEAVRDYPRLVGVDTVPVGPVGMRWGDARVLEGAEIADTFGSAWRDLNLDCIVPSALLEVGHAGEYSYELVTKGGTRILWGRAPGAETPGEPQAADKVARLVEYQKQNGTLEGPGGPQQLDVRTLGAAQNDSRTARKSQQAPR